MAVTWRQVMLPGKWVGHDTRPADVACREPARPLPASTDHMLLTWDLVPDMLLRLLLLLRGRRVLPRLQLRGLLQCA